MSGKRSSARRGAAARGTMKIGVFDSGLGGLLIARSLVRKLPEYDYLYLGDTQRVPYGNRSQEAVRRFLEEAVDHLFKKNCALIVVACNTASAEALRMVQQHYLPKHYPDRRVLGVIIPTAEEALAKDGNSRANGRASHRAIKRIGVLATAGTVASKTYEREIKKLSRSVKVFQSAAPLLVPLIENEMRRFASPFVREYVAPLKRARVDAVILGCTHYPALKAMIKKEAGVPVISQDDIIPKKLRNYLDRHPEMDAKLSKRRTRELLVTDITPGYIKLSKAWFGKQAKPKKIAL